MPLQVQVQTSPHGGSEAVGDRRGQAPRRCWTSSPFLGVSYEMKPHEGQSPATCPPGLFLGAAASLRAWQGIPAHHSCQLLPQRYIEIHWKSLNHYFIDRSGPAGSACLGIRRGFEHLHGRPAHGERGGGGVDRSGHGTAWNTARPTPSPTPMEGSFGAFRFSVFVFSSIYKNAEVEGERI